MQCVNYPWFFCFSSSVKLQKWFGSLVWSTINNDQLEWSIDQPSHRSRFEYLGTKTSCCLSWNGLLRDLVALGVKLSRATPFLPWMMLHPFFHLWLNVSKSFSVVTKSKCPMAFTHSIRTQKWRTWAPMGRPGIVKQLWVLIRYWWYCSTQLMLFVITATWTGMMIVFEKMQWTHMRFEVTVWAFQRKILLNTISEMNHKPIPLGGDANIGVFCKHVVFIAALALDDTWRGSDRARIPGAQRYVLCSPVLFIRSSSRWWGFSSSTTIASKHLQDGRQQHACQCHWHCHDLWIDSSFNRWKFAWHAERSMASPQRPTPFEGHFSEIMITKLSNLFSATLMFEPSHEQHKFERLLWLNWLNCQISSWIQDLSNRCPMSHGIRLRRCTGVASKVQVCSVAWSTRLNYRI